MHFEHIYFQTLSLMTFPPSQLWDFFFFFLHLSPWSPVCVTPIVLGLRPALVWGQLIRGTLLEKTDSPLSSCRRPTVPQPVVGLCPPCPPPLDEVSSVWSLRSSLACFPNHRVQLDVHLPCCAGKQFSWCQESPLDLTIFPLLFYRDTSGWGVRCDCLL